MYALTELGHTLGHVVHERSTWRGARERAPRTEDAGTVPRR
ncbi:hypothetical protein [Streptomyces sp. NPDC058374]